jgi:hypothetical protein
LPFPLLDSSSFPLEDPYHGDQFATLTHGETSYGSQFGNLDSGEYAMATPDAYLGVDISWGNPLQDAYQGYENQFATSYGGAVGFGNHFDAFPGGEVGYGDQLDTFNSGNIGYETQIDDFATGDALTATQDVLAGIDESKSVESVRDHTQANDPVLSQTPAASVLGEPRDVCNDYDTCFGVVSRSIVFLTLYGYF